MTDKQIIWSIVEEFFDDNQTFSTMKKGWAIIGVSNLSKDELKKLEFINAETGDVRKEFRISEVQLKSFSREEFIQRYAGKELELIDLFGLRPTIYCKEN